MNQAIQAIPVLGQFDKQVVDLFVAGDIDLHSDVTAEFSGKFLDAVFETLGLVGEGELCAFTVAGLGDAIGDGVLGQQSGDQNLFVGKKAHVLFSLGV